MACTNQKPCGVFVLAHPDDDIFVRPIMRRLVKEGGACIVFILTNATSEKGRKGEFLSAVSEFCAPKDIHFIGETLQVDDKAAIYHLDKVFKAVRSVLNTLPEVHLLVTHAWEMGHPDHDAAHIIGKALALQCGITNAFSTTYYRKGPRSWLLSVQAPHLSDHPTKTLWLSWRERFDMLASVRFYPSQVKTFIGLLPFMILRALRGRGLYVEDIRISVAPWLPQDLTTGPTMTETRFGVHPLVIESLARAFFEGQGFTEPAIIGDTV